MELKKNVKEALKHGFGFELYRALASGYGKRGEKAFRYLAERRVKKYKDFFVVVGNEEYIVEEDFCTSMDFQLNLKFKEPCAHIIAVKIAKELKLYDEIDAYYTDFIEVV